MQNEKIELRMDSGGPKPKCICQYISRFLTCSGPKLSWKEEVDLQMYAIKSASVLVMKRRDPTLVAFKDDGSFLYKEHDGFLLDRTIVWLVFMTLPSEEDWILVKLKKDGRWIMHPHKSAKICMLSFPFLYKLYTTHTRG